MQKATRWMGVLGLMLMLSGIGGAGETGAMGDAQHRKHMEGMHHPMMGAEARQQGDEQKDMHAMHHPAGANPCTGDRRSMMSGSRHCKHVESGRHENHERADNPED